MKKSFWTRTATAAGALMCAAASHAAVIDFETLDWSQTSGFAPLLVDGDVLAQGNYFINLQDPNNPTYAGVFTPSGGLNGQVSNFSDPSGCDLGVCPGIGASTASGTFLNVINDGVLHVGNLSSGTNVVFGGLQAAYLPYAGAPAGSTVYLAVEADRSDGTYASFYYPLTSNGVFMNVAATGGTRLGGSGTLTSGNVTDLFFYGYFCNGSTGSCSAFTTNSGNFAVDNIILDAAPVPEPSQWLLMAGGLAAIGAISRRRRSA